MKKENKKFGELLLDAGLIKRIKSRAALRPIIIC